MHPIILGIGAACAIALAEAGANICLVQRPGSINLDTFNTLQALAPPAPTNASRTVKIVECDIGDLDAVKGVFDKALEAMGGEIHVLVNCAGIQRRAPAVEFSESDWDDVRGFPFFSSRVLCSLFSFLFSLPFIF